jgi:hypothetical protein
MKRYHRGFWRVKREGADCESDGMRHRMLKKTRLLTRPTLACETHLLSSKASASRHFIRGGMIPTARNILTRPPTGTPRRAICPGEGLLIPQLSQREQADCSLLRASSDHRFIVGALRARRTVCLLPCILLRPRVARARGSSQLPHPPFFSILLD